MLNNARVSQFKKVYLTPGFTDLRRGIDGLAAIVRFQFSLDPYDKNTLFLFCGRRSDRIKALLWEGDGFLLLYKRLDNGQFSGIAYGVIIYTCPDHEIIQITLCGNENIFNGMNP